MAQQQGPSSSTQSGTGMQGQANTGVDNTTYNVISVVYHALQGAETIQKYLRDAQGGQHQDVEQFLREAQEQNKRLAQRGQECLQHLMQQQGSSRQQMQSGSGGSQMGGAGGSQGGGQLSQGNQPGSSKSSGSRK